MSGLLRPTIGGVAALGVMSCAKAPLFDVNAGFSLADASWFAEEETLFVFYEAFAEQGINDDTIIELTYATDGERVPWTDISTFETVHEHVSVDCGPEERCGSLSLRVPLEPREVGIRLRYHRDGELSLDPDTVYNVVEHPIDDEAPVGVRSAGADDVVDRVRVERQLTVPVVAEPDAHLTGLQRDA
ncbi:MAG: hypothetical protein AAFV53_29320, partial [Myxococcota bacterium]